MESATCVCVHVCLCVCVHAKSLWSCLTLCSPMDCWPPVASVHGILQARIPEWVAIPSSRGYSQPNDWTNIFYSSCIGRRVSFFVVCFLPLMPPGKPLKPVILLILVLVLTSEMSVGFLEVSPNWRESKIRNISSPFDDGEQLLKISCLSAKEKNSRWI